MSKKILVILGSVQDGRAGTPIANWFIDQTAEHEGGIDFELVDLAEVNLPYMNEPAPR